MSSSAMEEPSTSKPRPKISVYPQKLEKISYKPEPLDATGLTLVEKTALLNAWRKLKPHLKEMSINSSVNVFSRDEMLLETFRVRDKLKVPESAKHALAAAETFAAIMENIHNPCKIDMLLKKITKAHIDVGVTRDHLKIYVRYVADKILNIFDHHISPTLVNALDKMQAFILKNFDKPIFKCDANKYMNI